MFDVPIQFIASFIFAIAILHTFSGQTPLFLGKKQQTRTNNLHHHKAGSVAICVSLRLRVHHLQKKSAIFF